MFEDIKKDDNRVTGAQAPMSDPFDEVDPVASASPVTGPSALQGGRLRPVSPVGEGPAPEASSRDFGPSRPLQSIQEVNNWEAETKGSIKRRIFSIIVIVTVIIAAVVGGWYVYSAMVVPALERNSNENDTTNTAQNQNQNSNTTLNERPGVEPVTPPNIDQDEDGLTDVEEATRGTDIRNPDSDRDGLDDREEVKVYFSDPLSPDTDNDGLNDREEVFVWKTDPNLPDTDNDGFLDGEEVTNGYNPSGPGKLINPDQIPL